MIKIKQNKGFASLWLLVFFILIFIAGSLYVFRSKLSNLRYLSLREPQVSAATDVPVGYIVSATEPTLDENLISNSSFESDTDNNRIPDGWTIVGTKLQRGEGVDCTSSSLGSCSYKLIGQGAKSFRGIEIVFNVPETVAKGIVISASSKPNNAQSAVLGWSVLGSDGAWFSSTLRLPTGTSSSYGKSVQGVSFQSIKVNKVSIVLEYRNQAGSINVDDIRFKLVQ